jgi:GTP-binding protein
VQVRKSKFVISGADPEKLPGDLPEIAVAGKSNVGKSSFINCLCNNFKLAYVGATPGKTRLLNYFLINDGFYLVDLPGYGYARVSDIQKEAWAVLIEGYLGRSEQLKHIVFLVDIRHDPGELDLTMISYLRASGIPFTVVATKSDKISKNEQSRRLIDIAFAFKMTYADQIIPFSAKDRTGKDRVLQAIASALKSE